MTFGSIEQSVGHFSLTSIGHNNDYYGGLTGTAVDVNILNSSVSSSVSAEGNGNTAYGGLAGSVFGGRLERSTVTSIVSSKRNHNTLYGGLVGFVAGGTYSNNWLTSTVYSQGSSNTAYGGLAGIVSRNAIIQLSVSSSTVYSNGNLNQRYGGFIGEARDSVAQNNFTTSTITSSGNYNQNYGGLAGSAFNSRLINSWAHTRINSEGQNNSFYGGLIGSAIDGSFIANSWAIGHVSSSGTNNSQYGGLIGYIAEMAVQNSWAGVTLRSTPDNNNSRYGGLLGESDSYATVHNTWAVGFMQPYFFRNDGFNNNFIGRFIGTNRGRNYYDAISDGLSELTFNRYATRLNLQQIARLSGGYNSSSITHTNWDAGFGSGQALLMSQYCDSNTNGIIDVSERTDNNRIWDFGTAHHTPAIRCTGNTALQRIPIFPDLDGDGLIEISSSSELVLLRDDFNGDGIYSRLFDNAEALAAHDCVRNGCRGLELTADITLSGAWTPIGTHSRPFRSVFNGNGFTIRHMNINTSTTDYVGLFGSISSATIDNVIFAHPRVVGRHYSGVLTGDMHGSTVTRITLIGDHSTATFEVRGHGGYVGGLAGKISKSHVSFITSTLTVRGGSEDSDDYVGGLAGWSNSTISHVAIDGTIVTGIMGASNSPDYVGGLIGNVAGGIIQNSWVGGSLLSWGNNNFYYGGMVGFMESGVLRNNWAHNFLSHNGNNNNFSGGVAGQVASGAVYNNWTAGIINSSGNNNNFAAGLIGLLTAGTIHNNWTARQLSIKGDNHGVFIAINFNGVISGRNYYSTNNVETNSIGHGIESHEITGITLAQIAMLQGGEGSTPTHTRWHAGFNGALISQYCDNNANGIIDTQENIGTNRVWDFSHRRHTPAIRCTGNLALQRITLPLVDSDSDGLIEINSSSELVLLRDDLNGDGIDDGLFDNVKSPTVHDCERNGCRGFELAADITLSGAWTPIGSKNMPFHANFHGNDFTIANLTAGTTSSDYVGLFAAISTATISNLILANPKIIGHNYIGALAGEVRSSTLTHITIAGQISSTASNVSAHGAYIGGISGRLVASRANFISATVTVHGGGDDSADHIGGLVGLMTENSILNAAQIHTSVRIESTTTNGADNVGGIAGTLHGGTIRNSWVGGEVSGLGNQHNHYGGFIGRVNNGAIYNSWASVQVHSRGNNNTNYGGFIGSMHEGTLRNVWAGGHILSAGSGNINYGGFIGNQVGGLVQGRNYYLAGAANAAGTGISTAEATSRTLMQIAALSGANGNIKTHTNWHAGFGNAAALLLSQYCDLNGNGVIDNNEVDTNNRIWNFGTDQFTPTIHCLGDPTAQQQLLPVDEDLDGLVDIGFAHQLLLLQKGTTKTFAGIGCPNGVCRGFELTADIAMSGEWTPIAQTGREYFRSTFIGNGFAISGLYISNQNTLAAFFGRALNSTMRDLTFIHPRVRGNNPVGVLVGIAYRSDISGITLIGDSSSATVEVQGIGEVGGLVGILDNSRLTFSSSTLTVAGHHHSIGGMVGEAYNVFMSNISVSATVLTGHSTQVQTSLNNSNFIGGLVGALLGNKWSRQYDTPSILQNSWMQGEVYSRGDNNNYYGGLAGIVYNGVVLNSWMKGRVCSQGDNNNYYGGLIGRVSEDDRIILPKDDGRLYNSWVVGEVCSRGKNNNYYGGLFGGIDYGTIHNVWAQALLSSSGTSNSHYGALVGTSSPQTTVSGRNYYVAIANSSLTHGAGRGISTPQATALTLAEITALQGGEGSTATHSNWNAGFDFNLNTENGELERNAAIYCDTDGNGVIDNNEVDVNNRIWDFGTSTEIPVIHCTKNTIFQRSGLSQ